jgi:hypothetical protein
MLAESTSEVDLIGGSLDERVSDVAPLSHASARFLGFDPTYLREQMLDVVIREAGAYEEHWIVKEQALDCVRKPVTAVSLVVLFGCQYASHVLEATVTLTPPV